MSKIKLFGVLPLHIKIITIFWGAAIVLTAGWMIIEITAAVIK